MRVRLLIWPDGRKLYYLSRDFEGNVFNTKTQKAEPYKEKNRKLYAQPVKHAQGGMYIIPDIMVGIVYEQKGKEPDKSDEIIATLSRDSCFLKPNT